MHFSIYLPDDLAARLNILSQDRHINRSLLVRQALEEWIENQGSQNWPSDFFSFDPVEETPDFRTSRLELKEPKEWSFE